MGHSKHGSGHSVAHIYDQKRNTAFAMVGRFGLIHISVEKWSGARAPGSAMDGNAPILYWSGRQ